MTFRSDISVNWLLSPRVITIAAPSVEGDVQDIYDTTRVLESQIFNTVFPKLISAGGKEDLGGGELVGVTATLNDAVVAFEARKTNALTGSITTADSNGVILIDAAAAFITDGIIPGAWIVNHTDRSICSVVTVDSEIQLMCDTLGGGLDNEYGLNDIYTVHPVTQCQIVGGNLVAIDSAGSSISPILPTAGTQVLLSRSTSATQLQLQDIQFIAFDTQVTVDVLNGTAGVVFPTGTPRQPSNNMIDALTIASVRGFNKFFIDGNLNLDSGDYTGFTFKGESNVRTTIVIDPSANVFTSEFTDATVSGTLDGGSQVHDCVITDLDYIDGFIHDCVISGTITLSGQGTLHLLDCKSGRPGVGTPTIDLAGGGSSLALRGYEGGIRLINSTDANNEVSIDMNSGQVHIDATIVAGTFVVRGGAKLVNSSSSPGLNLIDETTSWFSTAAAPSGSFGYTLNQAALASEQVRNLLYTKTTYVSGVLSNTLIRTDLTNVDNFFNGMNVQIVNASGTVTRRIEAYTQLSGTIDVSSDPLPFTPADGDAIIIMGTYMPDGIGTSGFG